MLIIKNPSIINEELGFVEGNIDFGYALESSTDHLNVNLVKLSFGVKPLNKGQKFYPENVGKLKKTETLGYFSKISHSLNYLKNYLLNDIPQDGIQTIDYIEKLTDDVNNNLDEAISEIKKYFQKHGTVKNLNLD